MNSIKNLFVMSMVMFVSVAGTAAQSITSAALTETLVPVRSQEGHIVSKERKYVIRVMFSQAVDSSEVFDVKNWHVSGNGKDLGVDSIGWRSFFPTVSRLYGKYENEDQLTVGFLQSSPILVNIDSATVGKTKWRFGKGKAIDLNLRRLTNQKALLAFDYDFETKILEHNLTVPNGSIWFRSLSLDLNSGGTVGSDDTIRNGSANSLQLSARPYYFVGGLIYRAQISLSYQIETKMNAGSNKLFELLNQSLKFGIQAEVPYTNYPMFALHSVTGYARLAMPLTFNVEYLPKGKDADGNETTARWDFGARYELAFSPYLIIQGEWRSSTFSTPPVGFEQSVSYYSLAFAQDLDVVKQSLGFLKLLLGSDNEIVGKHFIFYKISSGRKAPAFQNLDEQSIGLGTFF